MTKLEAWNQWCEQNGSKIGSGEYTLQMSSHGKAFSAAWDAAIKSLEGEDDNERHKPQAD
jgi:hypothetical protein